MYRPHYSLNSWEGLVSRVSIRVECFADGSRRARGRIAARRSLAGALASLLSGEYAWRHVQGVTVILHDGTDEEEEPLPSTYSPEEDAHRLELYHYAWQICHERIKVLSRPLSAKQSSNARRTSSPSSMPLTFDASSTTSKPRENPLYASSTSVYPLPCPQPSSSAPTKRRLKSSRLRFPH